MLENHYSMTAEWILWHPGIWPLAWIHILIKTIDLSGVKIAHFLAKFNFARPLPFRAEVPMSYTTLWPAGGQLVWWVHGSRSKVKFWDSPMDMIDIPVYSIRNCGASMFDESSLISIAFDLEVYRWRSRSVTSQFVIRLSVSVSSFKINSSLKVYNITKPS